MTMAFTRSGHWFRDDTMSMLVSRGYSCIKEQIIGQAIGLSYRADLWLPDLRYIISLKWQQDGGTAEEKIPWEAIRLSDLLSQGLAERAYLVLGGPDTAWRLRQVFLEVLQRYIRSHLGLKLIRHEDFIALANRKEL